MRDMPPTEALDDPEATRPGQEGGGEGCQDDRATGKHTCIPSINDNLSGTSEDTPSPPVPDTSDEDRTDGPHYQGVGVLVVSEDGPGPGRSDRRREEQVTQEEGPKMCSYYYVCDVGPRGRRNVRQSTLWFKRKTPSNADNKGEDIRNWGDTMLNMPKVGK